MNLYLKYRPQTIEELDLSLVRQILQNIVKANNVAHAYLLTGPRGSGKTSTARVLARIVNCEKNTKKLGEPCNECLACQAILTGSALDVIEIDAASNRGIDDIRELKEKIRLSPAMLRKKVYIIDEVHMLTSEAFNALLKTLEEPPSHSLFILCTTELHKVPETIVSRCSQIQFTKATPEEMQRSFGRVIEGEGKEVSEEALAYLARSVDGSFRDGVKILDQVMSRGGSVSLADIEQVISGSVGYKVESMIEALIKRDSREALAKLSEAVQGGVELNYLLLSLMRGLRDKLIRGEAQLAVTGLIFALDEVARRLATSLDGELLIQVAILEWCDSAKAGEIRNPKSEISNKPKNIESPSSELQQQDAKDIWKQVLLSLGQNNMALDTILSKANPGTIRGDELTVYVQYDFHKQQLMTEKNRTRFEEIITSAVGRPMRVKCEVDTSLKPTANSVLQGQESTDDIIDEVAAIFSS